MWNGLKKLKFKYISNSISIQYRLHRKPFLKAILHLQLHSTSIQPDANHDFPRRNS